MEKTRVPKGEKYWYVVNDCDGVDIECAYDNYLYSDKALFDIGNYFHTAAEAEAMVHKIRVVLKGAEVYTQEEITEIKANAFADGMEAERRKSKIVK